MLFSFACRCVENAFGILAARFRIFRGPIKLKPKNAKRVATASFALHNFLSLEVEGRSAHCPVGFVDHEDAFGKDVEGQWEKKETAKNMATFDLEQRGVKRRHRQCVTITHNSLRRKEKCPGSEKC